MRGFRWNDFSVSPATKRGRIFMRAVRRVGREAHAADRGQAARCALAARGSRRTGHHARQPHQRADLNTVSWMARGRRFDRVVALDEFDLDAAAEIREHRRIPGMGVTATAFYRDKLAMRTGASESGFLVPEFCRVLNYDELRAYMAACAGALAAEAAYFGLGAGHPQDSRSRSNCGATLDELGDRQTPLSAGALRARRHLSRGLDRQRGQGGVFDGAPVRPGRRCR